jgi:hypothetical protein
VTCIRISLRNRPTISQQYVKTLEGAVFNIRVAGGEVSVVKDGLFHQPALEVAVEPVAASAAAACPHLKTGLCLLVGAGAATVVVVAMDGEMGSPNAGTFMTRECMVTDSGVCYSLS